MPNPKILAPLLRAGPLALFMVWGTAAPSASAQSWQHVVNLGGLRGSAIGGGSGDALYAGLGSGQVLRSADNGLSWTLVTEGLVDSAGRMLVPKAFLVTATGRVIRGGDNASWENKVGSPIFVSDQRGQPWKEVPLPFASSTRNPAGIGVSDLVSHQGAIYFSDLLSEGVWRSLDDGATWTAVGADLPTVPFVGMAKTYYALASSGSALLTVEATRGVFRSIDGGATWAQSVRGMAGEANSPLLGGRTWNGSDVVGTADGTAFAVVDARVYRSRDGGATWTEVGAGIVQGPNPFVPSVIQPTARKVEVLGDRVYVSTADGNPRFFEGTLGGESWSELPRIAVGGEPGSILAQSFAAYQGALYFAGTNGIHRLDLGTATRTPLLPQVTVSPSGTLGVNVGANLKIAATVRGTQPFIFEWRLDDVALAGQTGSELTYVPAANDRGGTLTLVVRNAAGSVTHAVGTIAVAPVAPGAVDYSFRPVLSGNSFAATLVNTFRFGPDGSVFLGGSLNSTTDAYAGVRKVLVDGTPDPTFVTGSATGTGSGPGASSGPTTALLPLGDGSLLVGAAGTGDNARYYRRLRPDGSQDPDWPWPAESAGGPRKFVRLADGRILVAGGSPGGVQRLYADGTLDPTFRGPSSIGRFQRNHVRDLLVLPDGGLLVGGAFNDVDGVTRVGVARLRPDGPLDRGWVPASMPMGSEVNALGRFADGRLLIGGAFNAVGGQARQGLVVLKSDGSLDGSFGNLIPASSPAGVVNAIAGQPDGRIWVGGTFFGVAGRTYVFRLQSDGTLDTTFPDLGFVAGREGGVTSLAFGADGRLWIGCGVTQLGSQPVGQLFRVFTDVEGPTVAYAGLDRTPKLGETVVLRGAVGGPVNSLQWRFRGVPILGATGLEHALGSVTLAESGEYDLVAISGGGSFTSAPVRVRVRGAVVIDREPLPAVGLVSNAVSFSASAFGQDPLAYQWLRNGEPVAGATRSTLVLTNLTLPSSGEYTLRVTGGDGSTALTEPAFLTVIPPPGTAHTAFRPALFRTTGFTGFKDLEFLSDGRVLVAGNFATASNGPNALLARLLPDGALDDSFRFDPAGLTEIVGVEILPDGKVVVLVRGAGYAVRHLLENGAVDPAFPERLFDSATELEATPDGGLLVAGNSGLVRLKPGGEPDPEFDQRARLNGQANTVSVDPAGRIYVAGTFATVGGQPQRGLARLFADGTLDRRFAPTNNLAGPRLTALADGVLAGDSFGFLRFDETGTPDASFGWSSRLEVWDLDAAGGLVGLLPGTNGEGVLRAADGTPAVPASTLKVPRSFSGYSFLRVGPDGAYWLALGGNGGAVDPATLLFKLHGTVTPLALVSSPVSQTVNTGATVTWTVGAVGTSRLAYQWRRDGRELTGETNATLVLRGVESGDQGDYSVQVSNRSGSLTSRSATLVVLGAPEIRSVTGGGAVGYGDGLTLSVEARGVPPLSYQWRRDGVPLEGATNATFELRFVTEPDEGAYQVTVSNLLGSTVSNSRSVVVTYRPGAVIGSFTGGSVGAGMELNVLPGGDFLVDDKAYNRFGELRFRLPFPDGTSTVLRDRVVVDAARARIYAGPTRRVRAYDMEGKLVDGYAGPNANVRMVRVDDSGRVLQVTEGLNPPIQRLDAHGAIATGFTPAAAASLDLQPLSGGKLLVLGFTQRTVAGRQVYSTTLTRLMSDGTLDPAFPRLTNVFPQGGQASRMALDSVGRILVLGGTGVTNTQRVVRWLPDGTPDSTFVPPVINGEVSAIAEQPNGRLVIVGAFTQVGGVSRSLVARLEPDGSHDVGFDPGSGLTQTSGQNVAHDVAILPGGEILVSGTFGFADGLPRKGLALFQGDMETSAPDLFGAWAKESGLAGAEAEPDADPDRDGSPNVAEFVYGRSPTSGTSGPRFEGALARVEGVDYPAVAFVRRQQLGRVKLELHGSRSAGFGDETPAEVVSVTPLENGLERVVVRGSQPAGPGSAWFFRFRISR